MKQYTTFLTLRTSPEDEREIARSCILTSYYHLREASFTCFTRAKINNPVASSSNPRPSGNAILPMPAGQAILKGGHHGRVPYLCRPPANIRKILTSSAQKEGWAIGRQALQIGPAAFLFLVSTPARRQIASRCLTCSCRLKTQSACLHIPCWESLEGCRIGSHELLRVAGRLLLIGL